MRPAVIFIYQFPVPGKAPMQDFPPGTACYLILFSSAGLENIP